MALNDLLRALEEEAAIRADEARERGRQEAERVRAEAEAEREGRRLEALGAREAELRSAAEHEIDATRREATRRRLEARAAALDRIRCRAEARLQARAGDPALSPLLRRELSRALDYADDTPAVLEAPASVHDDLRRNLNGRRNPRLAAVENVGGLVLRAEDGSWVVDATFAGRLNRAWPGLAIELARHLESSP